MQWVYTLLPWVAMGACATLWLVKYGMVKQYPNAMKRLERSWQCCKREDKPSSEPTSAAAAPAREVGVGQSHWDGFIYSLVALWVCIHPTLTYQVCHMPRMPASLLLLTWPCEQTFTLMSCAPLIPGDESAGTFLTADMNVDCGSSVVWRAIMFSARLLLYVVLPPLLAFWALRSKGAKSKYGFLYVVHTTLCESRCNCGLTHCLGNRYIGYNRRNAYWELFSTAKSE